jgi:hypothetical protein
LSSLLGQRTAADGKTSIGASNFAAEGNELVQMALSADRIPKRRDEAS